MYTAGVLAKKTNLPIYTARHYTRIVYPLPGILPSPTIAGAAMTFSSVSVILNALRLRNLKL